MIVKSKFVKNLQGGLKSPLLLDSPKGTEKFSIQVSTSLNDLEKCQVSLSSILSRSYHVSALHKEQPCSCAWIELIKAVFVFDVDAHVTCAGVLCDTTKPTWEKTLAKLIPCAGLKELSEEIFKKKLGKVLQETIFTATIPIKPKLKTSSIGETINFPGEYAEVPGELEIIPVVGKSNLVRSIHGAVYNFYALEEASLGDVLPTVFRERHKEFVESTARTMFDYLATICMSEARHAHDTIWNVYGLNNEDKSRSNAWIMGRNYNPRQSLRVCEYLFTHASFPGGYGGKLWAKIAHCAQRYFDLPVRSWFDHIVDLAHNGGLAFNKGVFWYNPINNSHYISMLNRRKKGSIFDDDPGQHFGSTCGEQKWLLYCAGLMDTPGPKIPPLKWGTKLVECEMKEMDDGIKQTSATNMPKDKAVRLV